MSSLVLSREKNCASRQRIDEVVQLFVSKTRNLFINYQERYLTQVHLCTALGSMHLDPTLCIFYREVQRLPSLKGRHRGCLPPPLGEGRIPVRFHPENCIRH